MDTRKEKEEHLYVVENGRHPEIHVVGDIQTATLGHFCCLVPIVMLICVAHFPESHL
jgi:hypothetical protein